MTIRFLNFSKKITKNIRIKHWLCFCFFRYFFFFQSFYLHFHKLTNHLLFILTPNNWFYWGKKDFFFLVFFFFPNGNHIFIDNKIVIRKFLKQIQDIKWNTNIERVLNNDPELFETARFFLGFLALKFNVFVFLNDAALSEMREQLVK